MYSIEQTDAQLVATSAAIRYRIGVPQAAQHLLHIEMVVANDAQEMVAAMPGWIPGSYKVRDFIAGQGDVTATDTDGNVLPMEWIGKSRLRISAGGRDIVLRYSYYGNERTVRQTHVNRHHAFINPSNCLMYVEGRTDEIHHVAIDHPWQQASTALSPVRDGVWGALNYDILADSPIELGDHFVAHFERHGAKHEVAITGIGDFDPAWITEQTKSIVDHGFAMWGSLPYDRYVFIIQLLPGQYGGLEHARSSVNMYDSEIFADRKKTVKLLSLLCHEYFHLWNVKRIRPVELGPFDYATENPTRMLWLAEGVTSYYDDLSAHRCGFLNRSEYLAALADDHIGKLLDTPGRFAMSVKDASYLSWVKLYMQTPDTGNRAVSYYVKGGVIMLLLDLTIIASTGGERRLDDGMRALMERYRGNPGAGITEEEFITIVSAAVGFDIGPTLRNWLDGVDELPIAETLALVGLEWRERAAEGLPLFGNDLLYQRSAPARWLGMQMEDSKTGVKVAKVWRDSPAEAAGIGAEDEVIAIDGARVTSHRQFQVMLRAAAPGVPIRITAASEGRLYETTILPSSKPSYEIVVKSGAAPGATALLETWLAWPQG